MINPRSVAFARHSNWTGRRHSANTSAALVAYLRSLKPVAHKVPGPFGPNDKPNAPYFTVVAPK